MNNDILTVDEAQAEIKKRIIPLNNFQTVILPNALGRTLAVPVISPINVPGYKNSAMDGYAVTGDDLPVSGSRELKVTGTAYAGNPFNGKIPAGECIRIMTGAKVPDGLDTVIEQEKVQLNGESIIIDDTNRAGQNVRHIGEDIAKDSVVLPAGTILGAAQMGVLASLGIASLQIRRRLRVAVFSSGDEIRSIGETLNGSQIYDSNRYTISSLLKNLGAEVIDLGVVADTEAGIRQTLENASFEADMIITSGGVSVGDADYIKQGLEAKGEMFFSKLHLKPGRPLTFGRINQAVFFGLPGNPVAVMVTFMYFVRAAIKLLRGNHDNALPPFEVTCLSDLRKVPGRTEIQRGILEQNAEYGLIVRSTGKQGSGVLSSMSTGNCFIYLPHHNGSVSIGDKVIVHAFNLFN
jgi:molybdopterin molybdotransferase